jgi:hypothetical protein
MSDERTIVCRPGVRSLQGGWDNDRLRIEYVCHRSVRCGGDLRLPSRVPVSRLDWSGCHPAHARTFGIVVMLFADKSRVLPKRLESESPDPGK